MTDKNLPVDDQEELDDDNEMFEHFRLTVDPGQKPLRIDKFLVNRIDTASRSRIQAAAEAGSILVNNVSVKANYKVKPDDEISIVMDYPRRELKIIPEDIPLDIVYEDDDLLVINKPAGLVVHPGHGNYSGTLVNALAYRYKDLPLYGGDDPRPGLVHRIDKNTTGLLVVAKTEMAKNHLAAQFFNKTTKRKYNAIVWGNLETVFHELLIFGKCGSFQNFVTAIIVIVEQRVTNVTHVYPDLVCATGFQHTFHQVYIAQFFNHFVVRHRRLTIISFRENREYLPVF